MTLQPLRNDVAVIPIADPDQPEGSRIIRPEKAKQRIDQGIVKYKGPDCVDVHIGDYVLFSGYTGRKITLDDEGVLFIFEETFVTAIIDDSLAPPVITVADAKRIFWDLLNIRVMRGDNSREEIEEIYDEIETRLDSINFSEGYEF